jgi:hypothetical protein
MNAKISVYIDMSIIQTIKKQLLLSRGHHCDRCKNTQWEGTKIPLEIHHIDGNRNNNSEDNLQILCPNCHALTPNFTSKNRKKEYKKISDEAILLTIPKCQSVTEVLKTLGLSYYGQGHIRIKKLMATNNISLAIRRLSEKETEARIKQRKIPRPSPEELKNLLWNLPASKVAQKLGVCDRIEKPPRGYWSKQKSQQNHGSPEESCTLTE